MRETEKKWKTTNCTHSRGEWMMWEKEREKIEDADTVAGAMTAKWRSAHRGVSLRPPTFNV